jgi:orotidine-5'-phosphate decarboxylase
VTGTRPDPRVPAAGAPAVGAETPQARDHNPDHAADQLQLLIEGTLVTGATRPQTRLAKAARELAEHILDGSR